MATATLAINVQANNSQTSCLGDTHAIFCDSPQSYMIGAVVGGGLCFLTGVTNILAGALIGAPLLAVSRFVDRNLAFLGNTIAARVARYAVSFFACVSVGTLLTAMCGFQVTIAQGALLILGMVVASVAFAMLALGW